MSSPKPKQEVTKYYLSHHLGISVPVDAILGITIKEKIVWEGEQTAEGSITINKEEIFGGLKKEGGVAGTAYFLPGADDQILPSGLAARFGLTPTTMPGFRGLSSLFFVGGPPTGGQFSGDAGGTSIQVWRDDTYSGPTATFTAPVVNLEAYSMGDRISSLKAVGPWVVYEHDTYRGQSEVVEGDLPDPFPSGHALHDKISSLAPLGYVNGAGGDSGGFYWTANSPYLPGVWVKVRRAPVGLDPLFALIPRTLETSGELLDGFTGLSWTIPCGASVGPYNCFCGSGSSDGVTLGGNPDTVYTVTFRLRGIVELITYTGGTEISDYVVKDATGQSAPGPNTYKLVISDPPAEYFLNNGTFVSTELTAVDYALTTQIAGGATITLTATSNDGAQIRNLTNMSVSDDDALRPIVVTQPYQGQFLQMDATNIGTSFDANPAHIIYECLTNTTWGMGSPSAGFNVAAFEAVAVTLYNEGFGLSLLWTRQSSIEEFVQEILDHIQAVIYVEPLDGLLTIALIRADYDPDTLPELTPDNCDLSNFNRKLWGEITNEIVVSWTNPENEKEETVTAHDLASISMQGGVVSDSRNYYGVRTSTKATELAWRDLRSAGQPLASCDVVADRSMWSLRPGRCIKLTWPEYGLSEIVMRILSVDYGKPGDMEIKLSLMEDTYGLDVGTYEAPPATEWVDPSADPEAFDTAEVLTLPLFLAATSLASGFVDSPEYPEVVAAVLAATDNTDAYEFQLWDEIVGGLGYPEWTNIGTKNIAGRATLTAGLALEAASSGVTFSDMSHGVSPTLGGFVLIGADGETGNELALITATAGGYALSRGVLDTVPREWAAGTPCWFFADANIIEDTVTRAAAEVVDYKALMRTSQGVYPLTSAALVTGTLTERPWLPNRPADVQAYGEAWSDPINGIDATARPDPWVTVTWAIRNRLDEDVVVLGWTDASGTAETGQTTTIEVRDIDGVLLATHDGLAGTTFDVPDASFGAELFVELRVYSERSDGDGDFVSLQYFSHWVWVAGEGRLTEASEVRFTEDSERRILED